MIHNAVDVGSEVRKQYVPRHVQMPETKIDVETLNLENDNLTIAVSHKDTAVVAITRPKSSSQNLTV